MDGLSRVHFKAVMTEIAGRFFSQEEADELKREIDIHTITNQSTRAAAAKSWETPKAT